MVTKPTNNKHEFDSNNCQSDRLAPTERSFEPGHKLFHDIGEEKQKKSQQIEDEWEPMHHQFDEMN